MEAVYQTRGDLVVLCGHSITDAFQDPTPAVSALSGCVLFLAAVKCCYVGVCFPFSETALTRLVSFCPEKHDAIVSINS